MYTRIAAIFAVLVAAIAVALFGITQSSTATGGSSKTTVCHATGSSSHPYVKINVPKHEIANHYGHGAHSGDIWAAFVYGGHAVAAQGNQTILANGCSTSTASPSTSPSVPTGSPTVTNPTPSPTPPVVNACPPVNLVNVVRGGRRNDTLTGTICRDGMLGHGGNDRIFGLENNDVLLGGRGNDLLVGGPGRDVLRGGFGRDTCITDDADRTIRCERVRTR